MKSIYWRLPGIEPVHDLRGPERFKSGGAMNREMKRFTLEQMSDN